MPTQGDTPLVAAGKLFSAIPSSIGSLTKTAGAAYSMPVANYPDSRFHQCDDTVYNDTMKDHFDPDMMCAVRYVPATPIEPEAALAYMEQTDQIDDKGAAKPDSEFSKWQQYCADRNDPWGSSSTSLEEEKEDSRWYTGEKCFDEEKITITYEDRDGNQQKVNTTKYDAYSEYFGYTITKTNIEEDPDTSDTTSFIFDDQAQPTNNNSLETSIANIFKSFNLGWSK